MATSINRLVASRISRNHRVSEGVFVTVKLPRVAKRPSSVATNIFIIRPICVLVVGKCRQDFSLQFPSIKTQIGRAIKIFVATEEGRFATLSILMVMKAPLKLNGYEKRDLQLVDE